MEDFLLFRILVGKLEYNDSFIKDPTLEIKYCGSRRHKLVLDSCTDEELLTDKDIYILLCKDGKWSLKHQKELDEFPRKIENQKIDYFKNFHNPSLRRDSKYKLEAYNKRFQELNLVRNKFYYMTAEGIANGAMWMEMIKLMYKGKDIYGALNHYRENSVSEKKIRDIALSNEWSTYSTASKNILGKAAVHMTDLQRSLLSWTNLYKNCRSNPDCPPDSVFADHDAFDGWLILESRKSKAERKMAPASRGIRSDAKNVYTFVKNREDAEEVLALNDGTNYNRVKEICG
jgi:hypothetical protein